MEQMNTPATPEVAKRPTFLTVLCILTFIGSGISTLVLLLAVVAFGAVSGLLESIPGMAVGNGLGIVYFIISFLLAFGSLLGAIMMWKLKKSGFYLYSVANIIAFILPMFMVSGMPFNIFGLVITLGFIAMYAANLKAMK